MATGICFINVTFLKLFILVCGGVVGLDVSPMLLLQENPNMCFQNQFVCFAI